MFLTIHGQVRATDGRRKSTSKLYDGAGCPSDEVLRMEKACPRPESFAKLVANRNRWCFANPHNSASRPAVQFNWKLSCLLRPDSPGTIVSPRRADHAG